MPIYEYACRSCGHDFELLLRSSTDKPACPQCRSRKVQRKFSTFAAHQASSASPCQSGRCPASVAEGSACAAGKCPYS